jgi:hypothetical protein
MADPNDTSVQASFLQGLMDEVSQATDALKVFSTVVQGAASQDAFAKIPQYIASLSVAAVERTAIEGASSLIKLAQQAQAGTEAVNAGTIEVENAISRITGFSVATFETLRKNSDDTRLYFGKNVFDLANSLADAQVSYLETSGEIGKRNALVFGNLQEFFDDYTKTLINDTRLYKFAAESLKKDNEETVIGVRRALTALRLDARDVNLIFQNEVSETGKITGEALAEFERIVVATTQAMGLSGAAAEKTAKTILDITRDFNTFGDITTARAASLTVTLNNLGLNLSDLTSVVGKFQSFDAATQAMSNFSAVTGATLDTLELFRLANEDPEAFVVDLREQLEAQGIQFEELNLIQQRQLSQAFGLDPRVLQRLMNENIESVTGVSIGLEDKIRETSDEAAQAFLNASADMVKAQREREARLLEERTKAAAESVESATKLRTQQETISEINNKIIGSLGGVREAAIKTRDDLLSAYSTVIQGVRTALDAAPVSPVSPTVPASPGTPGTTTAPGAPAVPMPTVPATPTPPQPVTVTSTAEVTVRGDGTGAIVEAIASALAVHLVNGVTVDGQLRTFVTKEPAGAA